MDHEISTKEEKRRCSSLCGGGALTLRATRWTTCCGSLSKITLWAATRGHMVGQELAPIGGMELGCLTQLTRVRPTILINKYMKGFHLPPIHNFIHSQEKSLHILQQCSPLNILPAICGKKRVHTMTRF